jgi:hypothetical protein
MAARIAAITAATIFTGGLIGIGIVGTASAMTTMKSKHRHGVHANGQMMVVTSSTNEHGIPTLFIDGV